MDFTLLAYADPSACAFFMYGIDIPEGLTLRAAGHILARDLWYMHY